MPSYWDNHVYCSPLAEIVSFDDLPRPGYNLNPTEIVDPSQDTLTTIDMTRDAARLAAFVGSLTQRDRDVVRRVFWLGETQASAARDLGLSRMAITKLLRRIYSLGRMHFACLSESVLLH
jgi:hypothetical protein